MLSPPEGTSLEDLLGLISRKPELLPIYAFFAADILRRDALSYLGTLNVLIHTAIDAGLAESDARRCVLKGFAYAAAGYDEPPAPLISMRPERRLKVIEGGQP
jgi:hypothetical protein